MSSLPALSNRARRAAPLPILLFVALSATESSAVPTASPAAIDLGLWGTNGYVNAIARTGDTLYIGGSFTTVGPCTGGGVPVDRGTGTPRATYPRVAGRVSAVVSDGAGGWYIGGHFAATEGQPRGNLAHVLANGSLATWAPEVAGDFGIWDRPLGQVREGGVCALALRGNVLYVGGRFHAVNGQPRHNLAAVDATTGALLPWDPDADDEVLCLALQGNSLYVGGEFQNVAGLGRHHIAQIDPQSGVPTAWNPDAEDRVRSIVVDGRTVYLGGDFQAISGQPRNCIAGVDAASGRPTPWDAALRPLRQPYSHGDWLWPFVQAVAVRAHTIYLSGSFDRAAGQPRRWMAAYDTRSRELLPFKPEADSWASAIVPVGNQLYVGGDWYFMGGAALTHVAVLDARTGQAGDWNPRANGLVEALAVDGSAVYIGGSFTSLGDWVLRPSAAALDLTTGRATDWVPQRGGPAHVARDLAGLDPITARLTALDVRLDGSIDEYVEIHGVIYMVGSFLHVNGQFHPLVAAVDANSGELLPWNPLANPDNLVMWGIHHIAAWEDRIFLGGDFYGTDFFPRRDLAAVDGSAGALLPWNPQPTGYDYWSNVTRVNKLTMRGEELWVGGSFLRIAGVARRNLAVLDPESGAARPVDFDLDDAVYHIVPYGDTVYVGGEFRSAEGFPRNGILAAVVPANLFAGSVELEGSPTPVAAASSRFGLGPCRPDPLRAEGGTIAFRLPSAAPVSLAVYDLAGRRVATLLDRDLEAAGAHTAGLRVTGWRAGVYFARLEVAGRVVTRKLLVVP